MSDMETEKKVRRILNKITDTSFDGFLPEWLDLCTECCSNSVARSNDLVRTVRDHGVTYHRSIPLFCKLLFAGSKAVQGQILVQSIGTEVVEWIVPSGTSEDCPMPRALGLVLFFSEFLRNRLVTTATLQTVVNHLISDMNRSSAHSERIAEMIMVLFQRIGDIVERRMYIEVMTAVKVVSASSNRLQFMYEETVAASPYRDETFTPEALQPPSLQSLPPSSLFHECTTAQERRQLGMVLINRALQGSKNQDTYAGYRRRLTAWFGENNVLNSDSALLLQYLSEALLAGERYTLVSDTETFAQLPANIMLGDRVRVTRCDGTRSCQEGQVKYVGFPDFAHKGPLFEGVWVGVQLDVPLGNHNGTVDGTSYFVCKPNHGLFVRPDRVEVLQDPIEGPKFFYPLANSGTLLQFDVRKRVFKPFGFYHGDVITPTADVTYKPVGTVVGVRGGVLWWQLKDTDGAVPCRNNAEELIEVLKRKKYKKIGNVTLKNHMEVKPAIPQDGGNVRGVRVRQLLSESLIQPEALQKVRHLINPNDNWSGVLHSPSLSSHWDQSRQSSAPGSRTSTPLFSNTTLTPSNQVKSNTPAPIFRKTSVCSAKSSDPFEVVDEETSKVAINK